LKPLLNNFLFDLNGMGFTIMDHNHDNLFENIIWNLSNLRPHEVSLVDEGANGIPFLVTKGAKLDKAKLQKLIAKTLLVSSKEVITKAVTLEGDQSTAFETGIKILKALSDKSDKALLTELLVSEEIIEKSKDGGMSKADHESAVTKAVDEAVAKARAEKGDEDPIAVFKAEMDAMAEGKMKTVMKAMIASNEAMKAEHEAVNKKLNKERDERITKQYNDEAKELNIGIEGLGSVLKDVAMSCQDETYQKLTAVLKVASDKAGFQPTGSEGAAESAGSSDPHAIWSQMEAAAKSKYPDDTAAVATDKFMMDPEGRELTKRFEKANKKSK
jgi:hypothetical protein